MRLLPAILPALFLGTAAAAPLPIDPLWQSETFRKSITASYGIDSRIEPRITEDEAFYLDESAKAMAARTGQRRSRCCANRPSSRTAPRCSSPSPRSSSRPNNRGVRETLRGRPRQVPELPRRPSQLRRRPRPDRQTGPGENPPRARPRTRSPGRTDRRSPRLLPRPRRPSPGRSRRLPARPSHPAGRTQWQIGAAQASSP